MSAPFTAAHVVAAFDEAFDHLHAHHHILASDVLLDGLSRFCGEMLSTTMLAGSYTPDERQACVEAFVRRMMLAIVAHDAQHTPQPSPPTGAPASAP